MPRSQRHAIECGAVRRLATAGAQDLEEPFVEDLLELAADGFLVADAVEFLQAPIPTHDAIVAIDNGQTVVERLQDVLAELAHPVELVGLDGELAVEAAVFERRRGLRGHRGKKRHVFAAQRLGARLAPERHHRNRPFFRDAGNEVVDSGGAPELDVNRIDAALRERIVERQRMSGNEPCGDLRASSQHRRFAAEAGVRDGDELRIASCRHRRQHQRHPVDEQRFHDAAHQALAQPEKIEIAVEVAREADERPAIVVAIAVVDAVEAGLNRVLHRPREQHQHHRRQERNDRVRIVGPGGEPTAGDFEERPYRWPRSPRSRLRTRARA